MFKIFWMALLTTTLYADTYVVADIANGMTKSEWRELGMLANPSAKAEESIYKDGEELHLLLFNDRSAKNMDITYRAKNKKEKAWKEANKKYQQFFKFLKKHGIKKQNYVSSNVIFLIDTSGSMKKNNVMEDVKSTMKYLINAKSKNSGIAIVTFDGKKGMKEADKARILSDFESSKSKLLSKVEKIAPSRYDTFLGAGLEQVRSLLGKVNTQNSFVLLFSDGKAVDDKEKALKIIQSFKANGVKLKVVAVGGADVEMLKSFSTTGYIFNATSNDLNSMTHSMSVGNDEIFLRLNNFLQNSGASLDKDDRLIIYSPMMNVDAQSDFYIVPNIVSKDFINEMKSINKKRGINYDLQGTKVYIRLNGELSATEVNKLRLFWSRYLQDSGASIEYFANAPLEKSKFR